MCRYLGIATLLCSIVFFSTPALSADVCGTLASRTTVESVKVPVPIMVSPQMENPSCFNEGCQLRHIIFSVQPNGAAKVAWMAAKTGAIHITSLDDKLRRSGEDIVIQGGQLRDFLAHDEGGALLTFSGQKMTLTRFDQDGKIIFRQPGLSGLWSRDLHLGSLEYNGKEYGAYFGVSRGGHEGDTMVHVSPSGNVNRRTWDWGCSHSIDMRILRTNDVFNVVCLSDIYPHAGFNLNHTFKHLDAVGGSSSGFTSGRFGGMAQVKDKFAIIYNKNSYRGWTAHLGVFDLKPPYTTRIIGEIRNEPGEDRNLKIARYGKDRLLLHWTNSKSGHGRFQILDPFKNQVEANEAILTKAHPRGDMKTFPNGDVGWATFWGTAHELKIYRVAYCDPNAPSPQLESQPAEPIAGRVLDSTRLK